MNPKDLRKNDFKDTPVQVQPARPTVAAITPTETPNKPKKPLGKIFAIVILILALGAGAYFGYMYYKDQQDQIKTLQDEKSKLEAQVKEAQASADSISKSTTDAYKITELGIEFTPGADLEGLVYAYDQTLKVAYFTTRDLAYDVDIDGKKQTNIITAGTIGNVLIFDAEPSAQVLAAATAQQAPLQKVKELSNKKLLYVAVPNDTAIAATTTNKTTQTAIKTASAAFVKALASTEVSQ